MNSHLYDLAGLLVSLPEAKCLLASYRVDDIRRLIETGAFSGPLTAGLKPYIVQRITRGDLEKDEHHRCDRCKP